MPEDMLPATRERGEHHAAFNRHPFHIAPVQNADKRTTTRGRTQPRHHGKSAGRDMRIGDPPVRRVPVRSLHPSGREGRQSVTGTGGAHAPPVRARKPLSSLRADGRKGQRLRRCLTPPLYALSSILKKL